MFLEKDFAFGLCLSVNVDFCCVGPVSSPTDTLHKEFLDIAVLFRNPSQAKVLTEGGDLREARVDIPLSVIHSYG